MPIPQSHIDIVKHEVINFLNENPTYRRDVGLGEDWKRTWEQVLSPEQKFDCYLKWNGIIGHTGDILIAFTIFQDSEVTKALSDVVHKGHHDTCSRALCGEQYDCDCGYEIAVKILTGG